jgi:hypothetical protein
MAGCAHAQTDESLLFNEWRASDLTDGAASVRLYSGGSLSEGDRASRFAVYEAHGRVRLSRSMELAPAIGYDVFAIDHGGPDSVVPGTLTDASAVFATPLGKLGEWVLTASAGGGYAGDVSGDGWSSAYGKATLGFGRELSAHEHLLIWADYNGNRLLFPDVPLPFVAYEREVDDSLSFVIGLPESSIEWKPVKCVTLSASWDFPVTIEVAAECSIAECLSVYAAFNDDEHAFHAANLSEDDRLFYSEMRVETGVKIKPSAACEITVGLGWAFSRKFEQGFDDRSLTEVASPSDAATLRGELAFKF